MNEEKTALGLKIVALKKRRNGPGRKSPKSSAIHPSGHVPPASARCR